MNDKKVRILIIDDELDLLEIYRELFELEGFDVITASSAALGFEAYKHNLDIQLIISDSNMGDVSGIELLKLLKSTYQTIPIFYLATGEIEESEEHVKSLGGHGLVLKPFDLEEILVKIKRDL